MIFRMVGRRILNFIKLKFEGSMDFYKFYIMEIGINLHNNYRNLYFFLKYLKIILQIKKINFNILFKNRP